MSIFGSALQMAPTTGQKRLVVGIDLGTCGVKVAVRDVTDVKRQVAIMDFGTRLDGYSRFAVPSTICVSGDRIVAGAEAEGAADSGVGRVLRSAKVQLLRGSTTDDGALGISIPASTSWAGPVPTETEFALCWLLATVLAQVHGYIRQQGYDSASTGLIHNLDVPVDQLEEDDVANRFRRLLHTSLRISALELERLSCGDALRLWLGLVAEWRPNAERPTERTAELIAEPHAVMAGLGDSVHVEEGKPCVVIDIGSGTTEVGVFRRIVWDGIPRICFYAAGTKQVGCDFADRVLAAHLSGDPAVQTVLETMMRGIKPDLARGSGLKRVQVGHQRFQVTPEALASATADLGIECRDHYVATWRKAYTKYRAADQWQELKLVLVGGGSLLPGIEDHLRNLPVSVRGVIRRQVLLDHSATAAWDVWGASSKAPTREEASLLLAARGLTVPRVLLETFVRPVDVRGLTSAELRDAATIANTAWARLPEPPDWSQEFEPGPATSSDN